MSHFSTVKTQLRKKEFLKQALIDLGYLPQEGENLVRGYRGQTVKAEMTIETVSYTHLTLPTSSRV